VWSLVVLSTVVIAVSPVSLRAQADTAQQQPDVDVGLTDEEQALLARDITKLSSDEKRERVRIMKKMADHLAKAYPKNQAKSKSNPDNPSGAKPARTPARPKAKGPRIDPKAKAKTDGEKDATKNARDRGASRRSSPNNERKTTPPAKRPKPGDARGSDEDRGKTTGAEKTPRKTPQTPPARSGQDSGSKETERPRSTRDSNVLIPDLPDENYFLPWDQRDYAFGVTDADYVEFVEIFGRAASLPILGVPVPLSNPPDGRISYTSGTALLDFYSTLHQVNDLLYNQINPPLYLYLFIDPENAQNVRLELDAVREFRTKLPEARVFTSLEQVDTSGLHGTDIIRVFFRPESAADMEVFNELVSKILGDRVLVSLEDAGYIDFYGRIDDLAKMRQFMKKFEPLFGNDSGDVQRLPVMHMKPSDALDIIMSLVENVVAEAGTATARKPRAGKKGGNISFESEQVIVIPDDKHKSLIVVGLPYKIAEIQKVLKMIDIPDAEDPPRPPIVVPLEFIKAEDAKDIVEEVVNRAAAAGAKNDDDKKKRRPRVLRATSADQLQVSVDDRRNALILQGPQELVDFALEFIKNYVDIPVPDNSLIRQRTVEHRGAAEVAEILAKMFAGGPKKKGAERFRIEPFANTVIYTGDPESLDQAEALLATLDVPQGEKPTTFFVELERAEPSFVVELMQSVLTGSAAKPKGKARRKPASGGNLFADDRNHLVYYTGKESEWQETILPMIQKIDSSVKDGEGGSGVLMQLHHADPVVVIGTLEALFPKPKGAKGPTFVLAPGGLLIAGVDSVQDMSSITETIALLDTDKYDQVRETRRFEIHHADPKQIHDNIRALFAAEIGGKGGGGKKKRAAAPRGALQEAVTVTQVEGGLIVKATPEDMVEVESLIALMDLASPKEEVLLRSYKVQHADATELAGKLEPLLLTKLNELSDGKDTKAKKNNKAKLTVQADTRIDSIIISAPMVIHDFAEEVMATLDVPVEDLGPKQTAIYRCVNASAADLAGILNSMFTGSPTPKPTAKPKGRKKGPQRSVKATPGSEIEIVSLPGDQAISVAAPTQEELDQVLDRAHQIDAESTSDSKLTRRFDVAYADVSDVAKWLVEMLDTKPRAAKKAKGDDEFDDWFSYEEKPNIGTDITTLANYDTRSVLVVATPDRMLAAQSLIEMFDAQANPETILTVDLPWEVFSPEHVPALETLETANRYLETLFGFDAPVSLDLLDSETLVMKGNRKHFDQVKDILKTYVDTPDRAAKSADRTVVGFLRLPSGVPQDQLLQMIQANMQGVDFEVDGFMPGDSPPADALIEEVDVIDPGRVRCDDCGRSRSWDASWKHVCPLCKTAHASVQEN
jgi:type II secretory pathway component GspD/PulD (secretin)